MKVWKTLFTLSVIATFIAVMVVRMPPVFAQDAPACPRRAPIVEIQDCLLMEFGQSPVFAGLRGQQAMLILYQGATSWTIVNVQTTGRANVVSGGHTSWSQPGFIGKAPL